MHFFLLVLTDLQAQHAQGYSGAPRHSRAWSLTVSDVARTASILLYAAYILQDSIFLGTTPLTHWRRNSSSLWRHFIPSWPRAHALTSPFSISPLFLHINMSLRNILSQPLTSPVYAVTLKKFCNGETRVLYLLLYSSLPQFTFNMSAK